MVAHTFPPGKYFVGDPAYVLSEAMYFAMLNTESAAEMAAAAARYAAVLQADPSTPAPPSVRRVAGTGTGDGMYEVDAPPNGGGGGSGAPPLRFVTWGGTDCGFNLPGGRTLSSDTGMLAVVPWALHDSDMNEEQLNKIGVVLEATSALEYESCG
jgi:hypothetical protein